MRRAAIGVRMHSGWGALVAVSTNDGTVEVIERRRIPVVPAGTPGGLQPYHFAKNLGLGEAEKFLANCAASSARLAESAVRSVMDELHGRQYHLVGAAVLLASGRSLPNLASVLASHALIHTAEGEFFRQAFSKACEALSVSVTGIRERDLDEAASKSLGRAATRIRKQISTLGRSLGAPWTADQKTAALAALLILERNQK